MRKFIDEYLGIFSPVVILIGCALILALILILYSAYAEYTSNKLCKTKLGKEFYSDIFLNSVESGYVKCCANIHNETTHFIEEKCVAVKR